MKNLFLTTLIFVSINGNIFSQNDTLNPTHWRVDGNLADSNKFIGTVNSIPVTFKTNNLERMRLTSGGRLGLGVKNPQEKLDVNGNVRFRAGVQLPNLAQYPSQSFPPYIVVLDQNGNLFKIPSDAPFPSPKPLTKCDLVDSDGNPILNNNPTWSSGINKLYSECPDVFVGIGTTQPRVNLDVQGITYSNQIVIGNINPTTTNNLMHLKSFSSNPNNTDNVLTIESPLKKLLLLNNQGLLQVREVKIDMLTWPDYVFDSKYDLMPLQKVEQYILLNKHLPNVPDAKKIEENGVNLGEMNKVLMEKIEELTLYLIQQNKRIEILEEELNSNK